VHFLLAVAIPILKTFTADVGVQWKMHHMTARDP